MVVFLENPPYFLIKQTKKYFTLNISNKSKKNLNSMWFLALYVINKLLLMTSFDCVPASRF